jgi:L-threonylcarbamoyladenylate synthase
MRILKAVLGNITEVKKVLVEGGVAVCPTDTVYGLVGDAGNQEAIKKIFEIKKRVVSKPLAVFIDSLETAERLAEVNDKQREFLKKVWPGKVTAVCTARPNGLPQGVISSENKIGLRIPYYEILNRLLSSVGFPLAQTSANLSGSPASISIDEIMRQLEKSPRQPDLVLDAGRLSESLSSTVIDLTIPKILREGAVGEERISGFLDLIS